MPRPLSFCPLFHQARLSYFMNLKDIRTLLKGHYIKDMPKKGHKKPEDTRLYFNKNSTIPPMTLKDWGIKLGVGRLGIRIRVRQGNLYL